MKRYLLFIISMLCVSIGMWADPTTYKFPDATNGPSSATIDGTTITIDVQTAGAFNTWISSLTEETTPTLAIVQACTNVTFTGTLNADDLGKFNQFTTDGVDFTLTGATLASGTSITSIAFNNAMYNYTLYLPASIPVGNNFLSNTYSGLIAFSTSGTTVSLYCKTASIGSTNITPARLAKCPAGMTKAIVYSGGSGYDNTQYWGTAGNAIIQSGEYSNLTPTNFGASSSTLKGIDLSNLQAWNKNKDDGFPFNKSSWQYSVDPVGKITVNGSITADDIATLKACNGKEIDFSNATFDPDISILDVSSSVTGITLPAGTTLTDAQKASLQSKCPNLDYIYIPTNDSGVT